jgi:hypothetical protein
MKVDLVIRGARVVTHAGEFHGGVAVDDRPHRRRRRRRRAPRRRARDRRRRPCDVLNAYRKKFSLAGLLDARPVRRRDAGVDRTKLREWGGDYVVRAQGDERRTAVGTEGNQNVHNFRKFAQCIG